MKKFISVFMAAVLMAFSMPVAMSVNGAGDDEYVKVYQQKFSEINFENSTDEWSSTPAYGAGADVSFQVDQDRLVAKDPAHGGAYEKVLTLTSPQLTGAFRMEFRTAVVANPTDWGSAVVVGFPNTAYKSDRSARPNRLDYLFSTTKLSFYADAGWQRGTLTYLGYGNYMGGVTRPASVVAEGSPAEYKDFWVRLDVGDDGVITPYVKDSASGTWQSVDTTGSGKDWARLLATPATNNKINFKVQGSAALGDVKIYKKKADINYSISGSADDNLQYIDVNFPVCVDKGSFDENTVTIKDERGGRITVADVVYTEVPSNTSKLRFEISSSTPLRFGKTYSIEINSNARTEDGGVISEDWLQCVVSTRSASAEEWRTVLTDEFDNPANWGGSGTISNGVLSIVINKRATLNTYAPGYNYVMETKVKWSGSVPWGGPVSIGFPKYKNEKDNNKLVFTEKNVGVYYDTNNGTTLAYTTYAPYPDALKTDNSTAVGFPENTYRYIRIVVQDNDPTVYMKINETDNWVALTESSVGSNIRVGAGNLFLESQSTAYFDRFILKSPMEADTVTASLDHTNIKLYDNIVVRFSDLINPDMLNSTNVKLVNISADPDMEIPYAGTVSGSAYEINPVNSLDFNSDYEVRLSDSVVDMLGRSISGNKNLGLKVSTYATVEPLVFDKAHLQTGNVGVNCKVRNLIDEPVHLQMVMALYEGDSLVDVKLEDIPLDANEIDNVSKSITVEDAANKRLKVFIWTDLNEMIPMSNDSLLQ